MITQLFGLTGLTTLYHQSSQPLAETVWGGKANIVEYSLAARMVGGRLLAPVAWLEEIVFHCE